MNDFRYRISAATSSTIHLSIIHSSSFRRTKLNNLYYLTNYLILFIIYLICINNLCLAFIHQTNQVPLNSLPLSSDNFLQNNSSSKSQNRSSINLINNYTTNKSSTIPKQYYLNNEQFNEQKNNFKLSIINSSSLSSLNNLSLNVNYLDKSLLNNKFKSNLLNSFLILNNNSSIEKLNLINLDKTKDNYLILDRNDLYKEKENIFLNLTRIKLKRNLDRKNFNDTNSNLNISDLYRDFQNWLLNSQIKSNLFTNQQIDSLKINNLESNNEKMQSTTRDSLSMVISMSILYIVIFITGVFGNLGTCIVILRNKYMRTATNYYLFSLSVSDLTLLIFGLPQDLFLLWRPFNYPFGDSFCILRGFTSEASSNASVLTITAFTIERYLAICQPLRAHTMSKLNRVIKLVCLIWISSSLFALPLALQFGIKLEKMEDSNEGLFTAALCTVKNPIKYSFEISTIVFFVIPAGLLTILYIKIGIHLRRSEQCITRQHVNTQHSQSPNESLLATMNAPPSSPNSNTGGTNIEFNNNNLPFTANQFKSKDEHNNIEEGSLMKSNLFRKMVRSCSNLSLLSSLSLKLNLQSPQLNSQINLQQINSQPNFQSSQTINNDKSNKKVNNNSITSISSLNSNSAKNQHQSNETIATDDKLKQQSDSTIITVENENKLKNEPLKDESASTRNKLISRLRNVIEEKDGEESDDVNESMCMLKKDVNCDKTKTNVNNNKDVNIGEKQSNELKSSSNVHAKRKQFQKMSPFSTLDSSSSNGWLRAANLSHTGRANTCLHSQDSSTSLNIRRRNWRFFKNRQSTRTIHHPSNSRRAVVKMLVAVVVAFFCCWAPFHIQRIFATIITDPTEPQIILFNLLTNISGVTYYLSATINPILYSIMSLKFRTAFRDTLQIWCLKSNSRRHRTVSAVVAANLHQAEDSSRGEQNLNQMNLNKNSEQQSIRASIELKAQNK